MLAVFVNIQRSLLYTQRCVPQISPFHLAVSISDIGHSSRSGESSATTTMDYDRKPYAFSSDTSALEPYSHGLRASSRVSSSIQRSSSHGQLSVISRIEDVDAHGITTLDRKLHTRSAISRIQSGQHLERRRRARSPEESNLEGHRPAELESKRYLKYREKAREKAKDKNGQGDDVWLMSSNMLSSSVGQPNADTAIPRESTDALQALRAVPPMGRKKTMCEGKLCGRNELIAKKIKLWTGVDRDRKKVSSHIQVLKGKMIDNPECKFQWNLMRT